jgi:hypothetical protein
MPAPGDGPTPAPFDGLRLDLAVRYLGDRHARGRAHHLDHCGGSDLAGDSRDPARPHRPANGGLRWWPDDQLGRRSLALLAPLEQLRSPDLLRIRAVQDLEPSRPSRRIGIVEALGDNALKVVLGDELEQPPAWPGTPSAMRSSAGRPLPCGAALPCVVRAAVRARPRRRRPARRTLRRSAAAVRT